MRRSLPPWSRSSQNWHFRKRVYPEEQKAQRDDRFLRGRQIDSVIYEHFHVTGTHVAIFDCSDLFSISSHGDRCSKLCFQMGRSFYIVNPSCTFGRYSEKAYKRCAYLGLINSKLVWHDENKRGKSTRSSSLTPEPQTKNDGKILRKESLSEAGVRLGRDIEDRAKTTSVGNARTPRLIPGILSMCQNQKTESGCKFCEKYSFMHSVSQTNNGKRMVVKVLLPC